MPKIYYCMNYTNSDFQRLLWQIEQMSAEFGEECLYVGLLAFWARKYAPVTGQQALYEGVLQNRLYPMRIKTDSY
jgi:hypothetical protein